MIVGKIDDLSIVDADCQKLEIFIRIVDIYLEKGIGRKGHDHCGTWCFFLEIRSLRLNLNCRCFVVGIFESEDFHFQFIENCSVVHREVKINLG